MKINRTAVYMLIVAILFILFAAYAESQSKINMLDNRISTIETNLKQPKEDITQTKTDDLKPIIDRIDNLESKQAVFYGDMNMLKLQQKLDDEEWKKLFEPMQKEYLREQK